MVMNYLINNKLPSFLILGTILVISFGPFFLMESRDVVPLIKENGFYQTLTAIAFLVASLFLIMAYFFDGDGNDFGILKTKRNVFVLALALLLFIGAGEELSWGQHMLGFEAPEAIAKHNAQGELNIHNLVVVSRRNSDGSYKTGLGLWLTVDRMFALFWFGFCVCIPLLAISATQVRDFLQRINIPIMPLALGMAFPLNYLLAKAIVLFTGAHTHTVTEVKEANFGILFCIFGIGLYYKLKSAKREESLV